MVSDRIQVLVVDDHTVVRKGLCSLLSSEKYGIEVVGEAGDGNEAIRLANELQPDVILMDLFMPGKSGLEAIRDIKQGNPESNILVLTSYAGEDKASEALNAGALGYLFKDASPDELVHTIRSVYMGSLSIPRDLAQKVMHPSRESETSIAVDDLTERELEVLGCVARGLSNKQIAEELSIGITTVRSHVSNILRKLDLENRTQIAIHARESNLL